MKHDLTSQEEAHVRVALRFLRLRCGGWRALAMTLRFAENTLVDVTSSRRRVSATLAFRVARFANVTVDDLLAGRWPEKHRCPHCGQLTEKEGGNDVREAM